MDMENWEYDPRYKIPFKIGQIIRWSKQPYTDVSEYPLPWEYDPLSIYQVLGHTRYAKYTHLPLLTTAQHEILRKIIRIHEKLIY